MVDENVNVNEVEEDILPLSAEEREYVFAGSVADDYFTLDICKCRSFNKNLEIWRKEAEKNPDNVYISFEDAYHVIIKVKKNAVQFPKPRSTRDLTDEQRQAIAERMRNLHNK